MKTKEEILNKHLRNCYFTHHVKLNHKYNYHILQAMEEYKKSSFRHRFLDWLIKKKS